MQGKTTKVLPKTFGINIFMKPLWCPFILRGIFHKETKFLISLVVSLGFR